MIEYGWGIIIFGIAIALWLGWKIVRLIYLEIVFWMTHIQATKLAKIMQEAEPQGYDHFEDAKAEEEIEEDERIILYGPDGKLIERG